MDRLQRFILSDRSRREAVVVVLVAVVTATVLRALLTPVLGDAIPWITFLIAVQVVAVLAGGPAAASTVLLCLLIGVFVFIEPRWSFRIGSLSTAISVGAFAVVASLVGAVGAFMRKAFRDAEQRGERLVAEIAQRAQAETQLRVLAEELRRARDAERDHAAVLSLAHIFTRAPDGTILSWGPGATELYGWSADEAIGRKAGELLDTEYPIPFEDIMAALHRDGRWEGELVHSTRDGRRLTVASHWALRRGGDPSAVAIVEVNNDITRLREAERARRESEARFLTVADSAPVHIWMEDEPGGPVFHNRTAREYVGPAVAALNNWESALHPDDAPRYLREYREARLHRRPLRFEVRVRRHDGEYRWFESMALPRFEGDQLIGYIGCSVDVHERRAAEQALRQADQRKDEFLAMLAHELRNPLAPIRNAVAVLRLHGSDEPEIAAARNMIDRQVDHMVRLIDDLLDVSRITRGQVRLRRQLCLLDEIVDQAVETVQPMIQRLDHRLDVSVPDESVTLDGDPTRLVQVIGNLLNNAAKYTPRGGRLSLVVQVEGPQLVIRVADNGRGIAPESLPHIFDLFVQEASGLDRTQGGLGVGLTVVKRLVELHGGHIHAYSQGQGLGSEFSVRLPIVASTVSRGTAPAAQHPSPARVAFRILIVEDNDDAANSLALLLRLDGHLVQTANDAEAALAFAAEFVPDVALIDIGLPGMSGYALASALREQPAWRGVAFMALSGYGRDEDKQEALAAGFSRHFTKPVDVDVLRAAIAGVAASLADAARTLQ